jgi:hypothetical protein
VRLNVRQEMKSADRQYQDAVDKAASDLASGDKSHLRNLELLSGRTFETAIGPLECGIIHQHPDSARPFHSIVVISDRPLWFGFKRRFIAGFHFGQDDAVFSMSDELMAELGD